MKDKTDQAAQVNAMLEVMWRNNRSVVSDRVHALRVAQQSITDGRLDRSARKEAESAAHKLAGILGTFGLPRGSALSSKIEQLLSREGSIDRQQQEDLAIWLADLEEQIKSKDL